MSTENIEYNGQIFSCQAIIDISSMINLLRLLSKRQQYLEEKINFQQESLNDKDKRISELEIMVKGVSSKKEEKSPPEKQVPFINKEIHNDFDLDEFLINDDKALRKTIYLNKNDNNVDIKGEKEGEKLGEKVEKNPEENNEIKKEETKDEKHEEKKEETKEEKHEEKKEENKEKNKEEKKVENKENKKDEDTKNETKKEENKDKLDINLLETQSPTVVKLPNLVEKENKEIPIPEKTEKKQLNLDSKTDSFSTIEINLNLDQNQNLDEIPIPNPESEEMYKKIMQKIKELESKIDSLQKLESSTKGQSITAEKSNKNKLENRINLLNNKIDQLEDEKNKMKEEMEKMKEKVDDFNVYDLFKGNSGDSNIDAAKGLIMALENKVFKKFGFFDLKFKKDEEDIFQNKTDITNMNNLINGLKETCDKNTKDINDLKNNNEDKYVEINKYIGEINEKIKDLGSKINENIEKNNANKNNDDINEINKKIGDLEIKISELNDNIKLYESLNSNNNSNSNNQNPINPEQLKLIKDINSRTHVLEKNMKTILSQLNIKEVYERLDALEKDLKKKISMYEINELKDKLMALEENEKDLNFKIDQTQQFTEKIRNDLQQITKKIEYLSGQLNRISNENTDTEKGKVPILDTNKFVDMSLFNEKQKEINKKFDKIRLSFEEVARNIEDIIQKLSHVPSDKDFSTFQSVIKAMIDDLKLNLNKKYAEKVETTKNIKFLETQIKTLQTSFQKKMDGGDNWLLAKKPLNNYVCASCESVIKGDLGRKSEYVAWNKYPNREEKSYRYGHGFSKMLQIINEDKKKGLKEKDNVSDGGSDSDAMSKLPTIKRLHINSGNVKHKNVMSDDDINIPLDTNESHNNGLNPLLTEENPKIMKIFKKNKNMANSSYLNRLDKMKEKEKWNISSTINKTSINNHEETNQTCQNEIKIKNKNE